MTELRTLVGSEKQIAWAEKIRASLIPAVEAYINADHRYIANPEIGAAIKGILMDTLRFQSQSAFWIDRRGNVIQTVTDITKASAKKLQSTAIGFASR